MAINPLLYSLVSATSAFGKARAKQNAEEEKLAREQAKLDRAAANKAEQRLYNANVKNEQRAYNEQQQAESERRSLITDINRRNFARLDDLEKDFRTTGTTDPRLWGFWDAARKGILASQVKHEAFDLDNFRTDVSMAEIGKMFADMNAKSLAEKEARQRAEDKWEDKSRSMEESRYFQSQIDRKNKMDKKFADMKAKALTIEDPISRTTALALIAQMEDERAAAEQKHRQYDIFNDNYALVEAIINGKAPEPVTPKWISIHEGNYTLNFSPKAVLDKIEDMNWDIEYLEETIKDETFDKNDKVMQRLNITSKKQIQKKIDQLITKSTYWQAQYDAQTDPDYAKKKATQGIFKDLGGDDNGGGDGE